MIFPYFTYVATPKVTVSKEALLESFECLWQQDFDIE